MQRGQAWQAGANLATLANALLGVGAIAYTLAGNKLFGMLLVVGAMGFDGLDGLLHRRSGGPSKLLGRVLDSLADTISFGIAPGVFLAVHTYAQYAYAPYALESLAVGVAVSALAITRLIYFTLRSYAHPYFLGSSTPQTTLALVVILLLVDEPGYFGPAPLVLLVSAAILAPLMVLPIPFPKIRRGARLRGVMTATSVALAVALLPAQFVPPRGSFLYALGEAATLAALVGVAVYYLLGPWSARVDARATEPGAPHG
jgi:CDP-diacylglycerol--serine O-phosphatidyltransferase